MQAKQRRADRGQSVTVFMAMVMPALLATTGLVIDGGRQIATTRHLHIVAYEAARYGADAASRGRLEKDKSISHVRATKAAQRHLESIGVSGTTRVVGDEVYVETRAQFPTVFLEAIGIHTLTATGSASAHIGPGR